MKPQLTIKRILETLSSLAAVMMLTSCGGNGTTEVPLYVAGTVSWLTGTGLVIQNNGSDNLAINSNSLFVFPHALSRGASYNVTVQHQPTNQVCRVIGGSGSIYANVNVAITCSTPVDRFAYVTNSAGVSPYAMDQSTGALSAVSPATTPHLSTSIATDTANQFAYVTAGNSIKAYKIDSGVSGTGALSAVGTTSTLSSATSVAVEPTSRFAYVTDSIGVSPFAIDQATGALSAVLPTTTLASSTAVAVDPLFGQFVYVASGNIVSQFSIASTGALSAVGATSTLASPTSTTIDPASRFAYETTTSGVSLFSINPTSGALSPSGGTTVVAGANYKSVAIDPTGQFAFVTNSVANSVTAFTIDQATGALTQVGLPVATGNMPVSVTVDPMGTFVYVANSGDSSVSVFGIASNTGALTLKSTLTGTGSGTSSIITNR